MKYRIIIRPEAEVDLREAFQWYEYKRNGLGYDFLLHVEAGLRFIERNAEITPPGYKGTRKYLIKRFPYKIIYLVALLSGCYLNKISWLADPSSNSCFKASLTA